MKTETGAALYSWKCVLAYLLCSGLSYLKHFIAVEDSKQVQYEAFLSQIRPNFLRNPPFSIYKQWQAKPDFNSLYSLTFQCQRRV